MEIFDLISEHEHEQVVFCHEPTADYTGIIAIHDTTLGPALGGTRFWNYATDEEAIIDALRLARGMTYKAAVAGLNLGGGKAVSSATRRRPSARRCSARTAASSNRSGAATSPPRTSAPAPTTWTSSHMETQYVTGLARAGRATRRR